MNYGHMETHKSLSNYNVVARSSTGRRDIPEGSIRSIQVKAIR